PANEVVQGVVDLQLRVDDATQASLSALGLNSLRALPGRGVRVWGARSLRSTHINVRRVVSTVARWLERFMQDLVFEPNDVKLWIRIGRQVSAFLEDMLGRGALAGASP